MAERTPPIVSIFTSTEYIIPIPSGWRLRQKLPVLLHLFKHFYSNKKQQSMTDRPDLDKRSNITDDASSTTKEDSAIGFNELATSSSAALQLANEMEAAAKDAQEAADAEAAFAKQCRDVYQMFDRGTGHLLTKDLGAALRTLGQIPSEREIDDIVSKLEREDLSTRGHTKLTLEEFYTVVQEHSERKTDIREMVLDSFRAMDPDNTGTVSAAKLTSVLTSLGEALSAVEMRELLQDAEADKDGEVDYVKFVEDVLAFEKRHPDGVHGAPGDSHAVQRPLRLWKHLPEQRADFHR
uniref:EF-hand domain-containing protein n=1 Tax=Macrostomum lignano TaxID=282301 RepID=A0A1I8IFJ2_9PLAT